MSEITKKFKKLLQKLGGGWGLQNGGLLNTQIRLLCYSNLQILSKKLHLMCHSATTATTPG